MAIKGLIVLDVLQSLRALAPRIRGFSCMMFDGRGLSRIQAVLLKTLKPTTRVKYMQALTHLSSDLHMAGKRWDEMTEQEQDCYLAEWVIESFEAGSGRDAYGWALSAIQKVDPRSLFRTAWKVFDAWTVQSPPHQAPAAPPGLITAMVVVALLLNRPQLSLIVLLCYAGLLRVREGLNLTSADVLASPDSAVLCVAQTKRGVKQKVVLRHPAVVKWVWEFQRRFPPTASGSRMFDLSYSSVLRWVKKLASLLGAGHLGLTTHSLRRSGASELSRQGTPLSDIILYGRWLRERSAREYIRQGEVAVLIIVTQARGSCPALQ